MSRGQTSDDRLQTAEGVGTTSEPVVAAHDHEHGLRGRIVRSVGWQYLNSLVSLVCGLLILPILTGYLGIEGYGKYSLVLGFVTTFQFLTDGGLTTVVLREISREQGQAERLLGNLFLLRLSLSAVAIVACVGLAFVLNYPPEVLGVIVIFSSVLALGTLEVFGLVFQVELRNEYTVLPAMGATLLNFGLAGLVIWFNGGLLGIFGATLTTMTLRLGLIIGLSRRFVRPRLAVEWRLWRRLLLITVPIAFASMLNSVYQQVDLLLLSKLGTTRAVGIYAAGLRLTNVVAFVPIMTASALFPLFSRYYMSDLARLRRLYQMTLDYMLLLGGPLAIGVTGLAGPIVGWLFKPEFGPVAIVLSVNIWATALAFLSIIAGQGLVAADGQKQTVIIVGVTLVADVLLNLVLTERFSYLGAALANTGSFVVSGTLALGWYAQRIGFKYDWHKSGRIALACIGLVALILVVRSWPLWLSGLLVASGYGLGLWVFRVVSLAELRVLLDRKKVKGGEAG